ncbi:arylsulfatase [Variovorax sp. J22R24]|uniref:arylsulfatase n=1 Tax=Variovorax gracilis TaxID=3053502 RepID=UPI002576D9BB|nr:arylsulfatase [Variovorax sp. J22R24]MDM0109426.1 arylsulfatase [Variovorax sp. J22R24]
MSRIATTPAAFSADGAALQPKKPNVVFMLMDNLGYGELGLYGGGILRGAPTPRIDRLAGEGMRLLNFNVEAQCTPSRSALMTGRFAIRSGTYEVPVGGAPEGLTLWEVTIAKLLSAQGYATGIWGKWHLGSEESRFPTNHGFDEWYGIPRTYDEALWPSMNENTGLWPATGDKQGWNQKVGGPQHVYEARKGETAHEMGVLDLDRRRTMESEITDRAVEFIKRNAQADTPFFAYVSFSLVHMPTLPHPDFAGKTGNGDFADCLAEMDHRTGQILDAIREAGIEDNTIVVFTSDNGPEATDPWQGDSGPWRGSYFTAMEGSLRAPFIIRWPDKVPAGAVNNEIVHIVDLFTTLAHVGGAEVPQDRAIDGVDQLPFFLGEQDHSNREGFPAYVADRLSAVKWRNWKVHFIKQENMYEPPVKLPLPRIVNLLTDMKEERDAIATSTWVAQPVVRIVGQLQASLKKYPPIKLGTPDPYQPPDRST